MGDRTSRAMVSVALVGVGPTWDLRYRDAIHRLESKLSVKAVCDSVQIRAMAVASEFEAAHLTCPWQLTQRTDLHAWLILDPGWYATYPAELAARHRLSALFTNPFCSPIPKLLSVLEQSLDWGESLMPEFPQRFTPATIRLRELVATKLGRIRRIEVAVPTGTADSQGIGDWMSLNPPEFIGLIDWCSCLIGNSSGTIALPPTGGASQLDLQFPAHPSRPEANATIRFQADSGPIIRRVECERGTATISSPTQISWQAGDVQGDEELCQERSPYEIILDQFCRRALGGLVPTPTVQQAINAIKTAEQARLRVVNGG
ncbi:MAG: hypothetical protein JSS49_02755 [Planctomycetes bacterium]|nr:hypothetical protein [Planctomycetota bacterium]